MWHEEWGNRHRRAGADGAKTRRNAWIDAGDKLPSPKRQRTLKGASSHLDYHDILKFEASVIASSFKAAQDYSSVGESPSMNATVKGMRGAIAARNVQIGK
jgi:hypothetical protein